MGARCGARLGRRPPGSRPLGRRGRPQRGRAALGSGPFGKYPIAFETLPQVRQTRRCASTRARSSRGRPRAPCASRPTPASRRACRCCARAHGAGWHRLRTDNACGVRFNIGVEQRRNMWCQISRLESGLCCAWSRKYSVGRLRRKRQVASAHQGTASTVLGRRQVAAHGGCRRVDAAGRRRALRARLPRRRGAHRARLAGSARRPRATRPPAACSWSRRAGN